MTDFEILMHSDRVDLEQELLPQIVLEPTIRVNDINNKVLLSGLKGNLYLEDDSEKKLVGKLQPKLDRVIRFSGNTDSKDIEVQLELSTEKLELIEKVRGKDDPKFFVKLNLKYHNQQSVRTGRNNNSITTPNLLSKSLSSEFEVPRSRWIEMLEKSGYTELEIFEVPGTHDVKEIPELKEAFDELQEAFQQYRERRNPMPACRNVVEHLQTSIGDVEIDNTVESMMRDLLSDTHSYLSSGTHTDTEEGIENTSVNGQDHLLGLRLTASCYQRIAEGVQQN